MFKNTIFLLSIISIFSIAAAAQQFPFPQHADYASHIKPSQYSQEELDNHVTSFYDAWKNLYLKDGCEDGHYRIDVNSGNTITLSEAMGYGMMILPLMAGYEENAQQYFNGLFWYFKDHPSHITPHLMAWKQKTGCINTEGSDSATDGDMDIAFGLLLAHAQWGSEGTINYLQEARLMIADMTGTSATDGDINQDLRTIKLGDWVQNGSFKYGTRSSDFIMDHFRSFSCAVQDNTWNGVVDKCYSLIDDMQTQYSPETGLIPDFIKDVDSEAKPANPNYLEGNLDGHYSYNACRDPWRMANDYLLFGDERPKTAVLKINRWLLQKTGGNTGYVKAGYHLDGTVAASWSDLSFTAPFTVGAMLDTNTVWLNHLYDEILNVNINVDGYYGNTLKLLAMLTISGNYWTPDCAIISGISTDKLHLEELNFLIKSGAASGEFDLSIVSQQNIDSFKIAVHDTTGRCILTDNWENSYNKSKKIDLRDKNVGLYLVSIYTQNGQLLGVKKIIKR